MKLRTSSQSISKSGVLITMFASLGLFQAQSIGLAAVSLLCLLVAAGAALPYAVRRPRLPVLILLIYLVYIILNLTIHGSIADLLSPDFLRYDGKFLPTLAVFAAATLFYDSFRRSNAFQTAVAGIIAAAFVAFAASILFGHEEQGLAVGFFTSHNALAGAAGSVLLLIITVQAEVRQRAPMLALPMAAVAGMSAYLFVMAGSRAFMVGFACAVVFLVSRSGLSLLRKIVIAIVTFCMLTVFIVTSPAAERLSYDYLQEDENLLTRLEYWTRAVDYSLQSPLIGVGIGSFNDESLLLDSPAPGIAVRTESGKFFGENHAHNIVLHILAEQGLTGLLLLSWFWASLVFRHPLPTAAIAPERLREFLVMQRSTQTLLVFVLAASMLGNNLLTMSTSFVFYFVAASFVTSSVRRRSRMFDALHERVQRAAAPASHSIQ